MKKFNEKQQGEFYFLYDRIIKIHNFLDRNSTINGWKDYYRDEILQEVYEKQSLTGLRSINGDLNQMLREWDRKDTTELDKFFIEELGETPPKQKNVYSEEKLLKIEKKLKKLGISLM